MLDASIRGTVKPQSNDEIVGSVCIVVFDNGPSLDAGHCATENRSVTRGYREGVVGGPERSGGTGGNVRPLPGRAMRVTGGELAVDGRPIENLGQIKSNVQNLQLRPSIPFVHSIQVCLICKSCTKIHVYLSSIL